MIDTDGRIMQRRKTNDGMNLLHCCCVCGQITTWSESWVWFGSYKELDDDIPVMKFCGETCKKMQKAITIEMATEAKMKEWQ